MTDQFKCGIFNHCIKRCGVYETRTGMPALQNMAMAGLFVTLCNLS